VVSVERAFDAALSSFDAELNALEDDERQVSRLLEESAALSQYIRGKEAF
jgi:hypothetical protein